MPSRRRTTAMVAVCLALVAMLPGAGCVILDSIPLATATKTLSEQFVTGDAPEVIVSTFNGTIDVSPSDASEVVAEVIKKASGIDDEAANAALDSVEVSMVQTGNRIVISAKALTTHANLGASVVLAVPAGAKIDLHSSNGGVVCEGIRGGVSAATSNGKLEIVDGTGKLQLNTSNGAIDVNATDAALNARTSNGAIKFQGTLAKTEHKLKTSNGRIRLTLPTDSAFHFEGTTSNGRIQCEFPITTEGKSRRTRLKGNVGDDPATSVIASTSNGTIDLVKSSDEAR
jgi:DUF4097 and DUF4098 domain-containing protein YvlB